MSRLDVPALVDVDAQLAKWAATHAHGPFAEFSFEQDVAPLIRIACDCFLLASGNRERMETLYAERSALALRRRLTPDQVAQIGQDCWQQLAAPRGRR